jgi:hypothetical protein
MDIDSGKALWIEDIITSAAEIADGQTHSLASILDDFGPSGSPEWSRAARLIVCSPTAGRQIAHLRLHYEWLGRPKAIRNLTAAIEDAAARVTHAPDKGRYIPGRCSLLRRPGWRWLKAGPYWFAYVLTDDRAIVSGVF